ncbi:MAG: 2Fe-2S iron-sulfur cluster binding domain-containing protein [Gammaproteobacteria bacterium]|nr:2Fe-2S iron-sulfur cluster binding domain-containing protein [Gammaproteobacteria bacterium]
MPTIHVTDRGGKPHTLKVDNGLTLMEPLRELDQGIEALCGGMCSCATCHVFIEPEWFKKLPKVQSDELELLESTENFRPGESRLACQVRVSEAIEGITLTVAPEE